jgi:hypothetical protein
MVAFSARRKGQCATEENLRAQGKLVNSPDAGCPVSKVSNKGVAGDAVFRDYA